ncbi:MAG: dihydrofolate reductase [Planctomycetota bacterium]|jgi:dihydrofolate reductase
MVKTALIVAMTRDGLIGRGLSLPWHWPEDLKHFKRTTRGHVVVMGRVTYESLCQQFGGPLKQRTNLVVSRTRGGPAPDGTERDGVRWFRSLEDALAWAGRAADSAAGDGSAPAASGRAVGAPDEVYILGGAGLFRSALQNLDPPPDRLVVTWVPAVAHQPGDTFFPLRPPDSALLRDYVRADAWNDPDGVLEFVVYRRRAD